MTQASIYDFMAPHQRHSDTSRAAAEAIEPKRGTKRRIVLDYIREMGDEGATDEEMQRRLFMSGNTQRPRRVELLDAGFIKDSGARRKTPSGELAVVWVMKR